MSRKKRELIELITMSISAVAVVFSIFTILLEDRTFKINESFIIILIAFITLITSLYILIILRRVIPKKYIFVLFAIQDAIEVKQYTSTILENLLNSKRYRFELLDSENAVAYGENIYDGIKKAMDKSDVVLLFMSEAYLKSSFMQREYKLAKESEKIIVPIFLEEIKDMGMFPGELQDVKSVILYRGLGIQEKQQRLLDLAQDLIKNRFD